MNTSKSNWQGRPAALALALTASLLVSATVQAADQRPITRRSDAPNIVLAPSFVIFITVMALNFLCDVVRAKFDVRESAL